MIRKVLFLLCICVEVLIYMYVAILTVILIDDDPLFYLVYERMPVVEGSLEPHLWGYRPRVTLEHLTRYMQQQNTKFPVLEKFLSEVRVLLLCIVCVHNPRL